jgi:hypothetical protein
MPSPEILGTHLDCGDTSSPFANAAASFAQFASLRGCAIRTPKRDPSEFSDQGQASWRYFKAGMTETFLGPGWSTPEAWGVWTDGARASLRLVIENAPTLDLTPAYPSDRVDWRRA